ncbi:uncharacterized protein TNCV_2191811 [Trichonephila clavipes]|nr:uncharacterized protein TNCV_2191811 [Trichonephila clavipes]
MWFQHDGTPAHFSADVQSALDTAYPVRWIGRVVSPVDSDEALIAKIAVVADETREMPRYLLMFDIPSAGGVRCDICWWALFRAVFVIPQENHACTIIYV